MTDPQWLITCWITTEKPLLTHVTTQYYYKHCIVNPLGINHCLSQRLRLDLATPRLHPEFWDEECPLWTSWINERVFPTPCVSRLCVDHSKICYIPSNLLNSLKILFHFNETCYCFSLLSEVHSTHPWHQLNRAATPQARGSYETIFPKTVRYSIWLVWDPVGRSASRKLAGSP